MECDFNLLCCELFKIPKNYLIFFSFVIFLICLTTLWFAIGNGKKCYFQYHLNIHISSQFSTTLEKDFEKGF
jgi:hypothetical protein